MHRRTGFVGDDVDLFNSGLQTLTNDDVVRFQQETTGSFDIHDSDFLSPAYVGSLLDSQLRLVAFENIDAMNMRGQTDDFVTTIDPGLSALNFDGDTRPVVPLGNDEIQLLSATASQLFDGLDNFSLANIRSATYVTEHFGDVFLAQNPDGENVPEISKGSENLTTTNEPYLSQ